MGMQIFGPNGQRRGGCWRSGRPITGRPTGRASGRRRWDEYLSLGRAGGGGRLVHRHMAPTPHICLAAAGGTHLARRSGSSTKTTPPPAPSRCAAASPSSTGCAAPHPDCPGIITATRGNHGQSQARAARGGGPPRARLCAARQLGREERGHARLRGGTGRVRRRFRRGARSRRFGVARETRPASSCRPSTANWSAASRPMRWETPSAPSPTSTRSMCPSAAAPASAA